jgi:hypothetical protein
MSDAVGTIRSGLNANIHHGITYAYRRAVAWSVIYHISRATIIVLSAFTSAKAIGAVEVLGHWQGYSAFLVAVLASLETWLKPEARYRVFYEFDDEYRRLANSLLIIPVGDPAEITKLTALTGEFEKVRIRFRQALFH